jgi:hypothetical protein
MVLKCDIFFCDYELESLFDLIDDEKNQRIQ